MDLIFCCAMIEKLVKIKKQKKTTLKRLIREILSKTHIKFIRQHYKIAYTSDIIVIIYSSEIQF
jgi:hypothetical protein